MNDNTNASQQFDEISHSRRRFLKLFGGAAMVGHYGLPTAIGRAAQPDPLAAYPGKDKRLIVHAAEPGELETPLALLREHRLTPKELLFVRNNQVLAGTNSLEPAGLADWKIKISGLVDKPVTIEASQLAKLPQVQREVVLQCSGNGRAFFSKAAPVKGAQWQAGAMGNVRFEGALLRDVFKSLEISPQAAATFLTAEGRDAPIKAGDADFEHSIPIEDALEKSLLATHINGQPLPALHGGPVRLVTPGFYATMNVKWVSRLRLESQESPNRHQVARYRTPLRPVEPGAELATTLDNSEANWEMRIKSVIFAPLPGDQIPAGRTEVRGVAFNDGQAKLEAVELSTDAGRTWRRTQLEIPASPYAWHPWRIVIDLPRGETTLLARAVDAWGRTQPMQGNVHWNPGGYAWNGVPEVTVRAG